MWWRVPVSQRKPSSSYTCPYRSLLSSSRDTSARTPCPSASRLSEVIAQWKHSVAWQLTTRG